jgi:hypothetical protein
VRAAVDRHGLARVCLALRAGRPDRVGLRLGARTGS